MTKLGLVFLLAIVMCVSARNWQVDHNGLVRWDDNCDFGEQAQDAKTQRSLPEHCGALCLFNTQCTHFNWSPNYKEHGPLCIMKSSLVAVKESDRPNPTGSICGFIPGRSEQAF